MILQVENGNEWSEVFEIKSFYCEDQLNMYLQVTFTDGNPDIILKDKLYQGKHDRWTLMKIITDKGFELYSINKEDI